MKLLFSLMLLLISAKATAVQLPEFSDPPQGLLPIDAKAPNLKCDELLPALERYRDMSNQHESSIASFLGQASEKINGWYETLVPLQGPFTPEDFEPIRSGGEKMSMIVDYAYENNALLARELDRILVSMRECPNFSKSKR